MISLGREMLILCERQRAASAIYRNVRVRNAGVVQELDQVAVLGVFGTDDIGARDAWAMARRS